MRKGKYARAGKCSFGSKSVFLMLALVLLVGCTIGGTLAWLTAETDEVANTFVAGQIGSLNLAETDTDSEKTGDQHEYIVIPGVDINKDPKVTYTPTTAEGTVPVDAYVFVKLTGIGNTKWNATNSQYEIKSGTNVVMSFQIADGWTAVEGHSDVYYQTSTGSTGLSAVSIIKDNKITVSDKITKDDVAAVATAADGLTFTAYAIQQADGGTENDGKFTPAEAWEKVSSESKATTP